MPARRISDEPAYVLHRYDWSESSLILDVFTRHHGRVALVAKGAKKPTSNFRPVLLPLQPLRVGYTISAGGSGEGGQGEVHALKGAEWVGGHVMPTGGALLSGLYLNELLMRLVAREDAHASLFDAYAGVVRVLGSGEHGDTLEPVLRSFELLLLREIGLLPALDAETLTLERLKPAARYALVPEAGLRAAQLGDRATLPGAQWLALQRALESGGAGSYTVTLRAIASSVDAPMTSDLKPQLRTLLQYHCGSPLLRTRQLMMDLQLL
ncbi:MULTISPECIES: DNA repair protein RecO [unclassified Acidovorax]|uniref:DNA repair protein RecO n=1 Tax=unclassified Acidovorax TaxID=2684926 RepID=UPI002882E43D|nr:MULTISPECIES: DNA repair protein RecO [unclassified Acidovorax]